MTSVNVVDIPGNLPVSAIAGTANFSFGAERRVMMFFKGTTTSTSHGDDLSLWVGNLLDIEGIIYCTSDNVSATVQPTWSGPVITWACGTGVIEACIIGRMK